MDDFEWTIEQQRIIIHQSLFGWVIGPPGVGKTLVLVRKALQWLEDGMDVHIISLFEKGVTPAESIYSKILRATHARKNVHVHHTFIKGETSTIEDLKTAIASGSRKVAVIMDDAHPVCSVYKEIDPLGHQPLPSAHEYFIRSIIQLGVRALWAASIHPVGMSIMDHHLVTKSFRPFSREIAKSFNLEIKYQNHAPQANVMALTHHVMIHDDDDHHGITPVECFFCGKKLAKTVLESKHSFKDILILSLKVLTDDTPLLQGLHQGGVPTKLIADINSIIKLVRSQEESEKDVVVVSGIFKLGGLNRPLVVWVQGSSPYKTPYEIDLSRVYGMSRATTQLICVCNDSVSHEAGWQLD